MFGSLFAGWEDWGKHLSICSSRKRKIFKFATDST